MLLVRRRLRVWQSGYFNDRDRDFYLTFDRHMDHMMDAFKAGKQPPVHARAGRRVLQLAFAAIKSFESEKKSLWRQIPLRWRHRRPFCRHRRIRKSGQLIPLSAEAINPAVSFR